MPPVGKYLSGDDVIKSGSHEFTVLETLAIQKVVCSTIAAKRIWHSLATLCFICLSEGRILKGAVCFRSSKVSE